MRKIAFAAIALGSLAIASPALAGGNWTSTSGGCYWNCNPPPPPPPPPTGTSGETPPPEVPEPGMLGLAGLGLIGLGAIRMRRRRK